MTGALVGVITMLGFVVLLLLVVCCFHAIVCILFCLLFLVLSRACVWFDDWLVVV